MWLHPSGKVEFEGNGLVESGRKQQADANSCRVQFGIHKVTERTGSGRLKGLQFLDDIKKVSAHLIRAARPTT